MAQQARIARQSAQLPGRVVPAFLEGLDVLKLSKPGIPDFDEQNEHLSARTGWTVAAVPGLVPDEVFFQIVEPVPRPSAHSK